MIQQQLIQGLIVAHESLGMLQHWLDDGLIVVQVVMSYCCSNWKPQKSLKISDAK